MKSFRGKERHEELRPVSATNGVAAKYTEAPVPQGSAPRRVRKKIMTGFEPGVRQENGATIVTTPDVVEVLGDPEAWAKAVADLGVTVPPGWAVRLVEMRHDPAAWQRAAEGEKATTGPVWRYRFRVEPAAPSAGDIEELIAVAKKARATRKPSPRGEAGETAFIAAIGDTQIGKAMAGGDTGTIQRVLDSTERAVDRLKQLRKLGHRPETVYICWLGDACEGFVSQGGSNAWRTQTPLTEQVRIVRRLMLAQIDAFRSVADQVVLASIPGNHDEAVRFGKGGVTRYDDSWAIESAVAVHDALAVNPRVYGNCSVVVSEQDELTLTLDMAGTIVGMAHGHQMKVGKAMEWWANQAHGMQPIGEATLLLTGHLHHLRVEQSGFKTHIQTPALEAESQWWKHRTGQVSPPGMTTLLVGEGVGKSGWADLQVV